MSFTVNDFRDLLHLIEVHPEWRLQLKRALFPDLDLEKSLQEMQVAIARLAIGQDALRTDVEILKQDVGILKQDVRELKKDMRDLKGRSQEDFYRQRIGSIFSQYLRKGADASDWIGDLLHDKVSEKIVTAAEVKQVMAADLLWLAETRDTRRKIVLVLEASWLAEESDVDRATKRAEILRRAGIDAFALVGGHEWQESTKAKAWQAKVITTSNGRLDDESWLNVVQMV
ncbi:MAG TPA: hypothetical protein PKE20_12360 [Promineifilum sp.]|nr:hypothetical protein [Promineifilum sp.]